MAGRVTGLGYRGELGMYRKVVKLGNVKGTREREFNC
jgi:hypothetical protein